MLCFYLVLGCKTYISHIQITFPCCVFLMCHTTFLQLEMAEECLLHALDLSGLLLLYSSIGDAEGITKLASMAKEQGKNNVAFLCLFMLGKLEECLQLLIERYGRFSETVLFHTSLLQTSYCMLTVQLFSIQQSHSGSSIDGEILSSEQSP